MQAGPTTSQRRFRALLLVLCSALVALAMMWGLAKLIDQAGAPPPKKPERIEIALVDPPAPAQPPAKSAPRPKPRTQIPRVPKPPEPRPKPKTEPKKPKTQKPQPPKRRMKMVEQDPNQKTPPPENPDYLSNVDRKVEKQTRAKEAKLDSKRPQARPSSKARRKPTQAAKKQIKRDAKAEKTKGSPLLTMRGPPKARPSSQSKDPLRTRDDGQLQRQSPSQNPMPAGQQGQHDRRRPRLNLGGSAAAMQAAVTPQIASEGSQRFKPPQKEGLWDKARKSYQSPLDNVVPEVQPGNQTALNSRRHPFAQYIAEMHRSIHMVWGDGVLRAWDRLPASHAWNDFSLWTRVEIVLWPSGEIDSVKTVRRSGNSSFDGVARNSVYNAGPYPEAPGEIHSGNGKVYIHWAFHRNAYACGTFGAEPFILDNAGHGPRPDPSAPIDEGAVPIETRRRVYGPAAAPTR